MILRYIITFLILFFVITSCVERGKPIKKKATEEVNKTDKSSKLAHYICPNGHGGSDKQGTCNDCQETLVHNQAYHGLNIPKTGVQDPFNTNTSNNKASSPAQNKYGDYHYICPNGHPGGSGSAGECATCKAKLAHNQNYHK